jgi:hypothetical protein
VTVAAFVLGIIGTVLAAASLACQVASFVYQGARPKLTPVVGIVTPGGMVTHDATRDAREGLVHAAAQLPPGPLIIVVKVVNAGRTMISAISGWPCLESISDWRRQAAIMPVFTSTWVSESTRVS